MRGFFLSILAVLVVFSQVMVYRTQSKSNTGAPILYWVTDPNPARTEQIALFRSWLKKNKYPDIEVRVDTANSGMQKIVVQGVTGVAGDMIDASGNSIPILAEMGLLEDLAPIFKEFGLPLYECYPGNRHELVVGEKVYGTPCNAWPALYLVNVDTFQKLGLPPPPPRMTFAEFESAGKAFIAKANAGRKRQEVWFAYGVTEGVLLRSKGISRYNETLTGPWADWRAAAPIYQMIYDWTFRDHLIPSAAEKSSMASEQGYGGGDLQFLNKGLLGMHQTGRHALIQMRLMKPAVNWATCEPPHGGYPNTLSGTRSLVMYKGGKNKQWAKYFFAFLRSEDYSMQIVRDADSMPPLPRATLAEEYRRPAGFTNEWNAHAGYAKAAEELAIGFEISPFQPPTLKNLKTGAFGAFMSGVGTAESAARDLYEGTMEIIERSVNRSADRKAAWLKACAVQEKIDAMKARGEKIPASLIANNFLRKYYLDTGKAFRD